MDLRLLVLLSSICYRQSLSGLSSVILCLARRLTLLAVTWWVPLSLKVQRQAIWGTQNFFFFVCFFFEIDLSKIFTDRPKYAIHIFSIRSASYLPYP